ncbi:MAG: substrate-binding domain-containing protein [Bryobacteraceae bacterium]
MLRTLALLAIAICLPGCSQKQTSKPLVGVVPKGTNHIFWQTVHAGAMKAGMEFGLDIEWNAPALEIDASRQIGIVDSMVNRHLAGIVLAPVDRKALVAPVERAMKAGIPVAIFDSEVDTPQRITYVATNNREGGRMAARQLAELIGNKGKVALIGFMAGSASTMEREQGFEDELRAKFPDIQLIQTIYAKASQAAAMSGTENILTAHPDLAGLFADNESSSAGAVQALKSRSETKVRMVAFDGSDQLIADLRHRHLDAIILQDPFKMGYEATKAIAMKLKGETPPATVDSGALMVTRSDLEKPDVIPLLYPDIQRYLRAK